MISTAIINQKGGVGKTTTVANLGVALSRQNKKVLLIDLDPQAHLTLHLGIDPNNTTPNTYTLLTKSLTIAQVRKQLGENLWIVPSHIDLATAETELVSVIGRETILRDALEDDSSNYHYVLIDCPPSLGLLTLNGLCAVREIIIPMQAHFLALQGVGKLLETVKLVHQRINSQLMVRGVLLCLHDASTRLSCEVEQDLKSFFDQDREANLPWSLAQVFQTTIRRNIKLAECPSYGLSVFDYAPKSNGAADHQSLCRELLDIHQTEINPSPTLTVRLAQRLPDSDGEHSGTPAQTPMDMEGGKTDGEKPLANTA